MINSIPGLNLFGTEGRLRKQTSPGMYLIKAEQDGRSSINQNRETEVSLIAEPFFQSLF
jgi:hypothetical protein